MNITTIKKTAVYLLVLVVALLTEYHQVYYQEGFDMMAHIRRIMPIVNGTYFLPHPLFHYTVYGIFSVLQLCHLHVTLEDVAFIFTSICILFIFHLTYKTLRYFIDSKVNDIALLLCSFALIMVMAVYVPFFSHNVYLGQWSPNIWHSPTMFLLKPFAIIAALLMGVYLTKTELKNKGQYITLSLCLALSAFAKPSFVFSFFPAIGIFILLYRRTNIKVYKQVFFIVLPTLLVLVWQYFSTYFADITTTTDLKDKIVLTFFGVTKLYSPNVFISLILAIAFPLAVVCVDFKNAIKNKILILMWLNAFVAYLQSSFLAEEFKFEQAAFSFGYSISLTILFIYSLVHFLQFVTERKQAGYFKLKSILVWSIFGLHFVAGVYYYYNMFFYNNYC
jgi:hypothetical protein